MCSVQTIITRFIGDSNLSNALTAEILAFANSLNADQDLAARLLSLVWESAVTQFELEKWSSASKSKLNFPYSSWPEVASYDEEKRAKCDANLVVKLHERLLQSQPTDASKLLAKLQSQTESISDKELCRLIVPLLGEMIHMIVHSPLDAFEFYKSIMTTYIMRIVGKEPEKPRDWVRNEEKDQVRCSRKCSDCQSLQDFLIDPKEETCTFPIGYDAVGHFKCYIPDQCKTAIDVWRTPPVVTVTKTYKVWEASRLDWKRRVSEAQYALGRLPREVLRKCLGDEYDAIMSMDMVWLPEDDATGQTVERLPKRTKIHAE